MNMIIEDYLNIENDFFELNSEEKIAYMNLYFDKPSDIMNKNSITKTPIFNDEFISWISKAFKRAPRGYRIDLNIEFKDFEGYDNESLCEIFKKNILLEVKANKLEADGKNKTAFSLIIIGIIFFLAMLLINNLWKSGGVAKDIFSYIADIATTVTFWEAMTILVVNNKERRSYLKCLYNKFNKIEFVLKN